MARTKQDEFVGEFMGAWICDECASKRSWEHCELPSTWHEGKCYECGKVKPVTEPRDYNKNQDG
jgi:hypothetical protein